MKKTLVHTLLLILALFIGIVIGIVITDEPLEADGTSGR